MLIRKRRRGGCSCRLSGTADAGDAGKRGTAGTLSDSPEGLKELGIPIYITQQYTRGLGMTVPEIVEAAGTREYLEKISYSAAEEVIPKLGGKKSVILCGIESHICVLQTVIDLKSRGFQPVLVTDCISSRKARDLEMALERARLEGAILTTYEALLFELLGKAGTTEARKIQKLIK